MEIQKSTLVTIVIILVVIFVSIGLIAIFSNGDDGSDNSEGEINATTFETVDVQTFEQKIAIPESVTIDIRTPEEYSQGKIEGSINLDFYAPEFKSELRKLDKNGKYNIYCNSGNRSGITMDTMKEMGFTYVIELDGGIQAWVSEGSEICTNC